MSFRKFGTSDDQKVSLDNEDQEAIRKSASAKPQLTEEDRRELQQENEK